MKPNEYVYSWRKRLFEVRVKIRELRNQAKVTKNKASLSHCAKVQKYDQSKIGLQFFDVLIMQQNIMEKELTSCTGVLLRADLTGHGQFSQLADICQKGWDGHALLGQPSKRSPVQDFNSFSIMFYYIFSITYQKIGDLFCPVIFLDFPTVCSCGKFRKFRKFRSKHKFVSHVGILKAKINSYIL